MTHQPQPKSQNNAPGATEKKAEAAGSSLNTSFSSEIRDQVKDIKSATDLTEAVEAVENGQRLRVRVSGEHPLLKDSLRRMTFTRAIRVREDITRIGSEEALFQKLQKRFDSQGFQDLVTDLNIKQTPYRFLVRDREQTKALSNVLSTLKRMGYEIPACIRVKCEDNYKPAVSYELTTDAGPHTGKK